MTIDGSYSLSELLGLVLRCYVVPQRQQDTGTCSAGIGSAGGVNGGDAKNTRCRPCRPFPLRSEVLSLSLSLS